MIKGLNQNQHPEATSSQYAYWAKNAIWSKKLDAIINEPGLKTNPFILPAELLNGGWKIGITTIGSKIILFYKGNYSGIYKDCIAILDEDNGSVDIRVERLDLNFGIENPIRAKAKFNAKGELIVAFVDGKRNTPKYINLTTASPTDSLNFYELFPFNHNADNITTEVENSGNLLTGTYWAAFQYISKDKSRSSWSVTSNPTYITTHKTAPIAGIGDSKGSDTGLGADKSISVQLSGLDTDYNRVALAIISKINGVVTAKIVKEVPITSANITIFYSGAEFISDITVDEIITTSVRYTTAENIEVLEDQLFLADMTAPQPIDFQTIVNQTEVRWVSRYNEDGQGDQTVYTKFKAGNKKTFLHDEIYALYMQFELLDGTLSSWFHIPGRAALAGELNNCSVGNLLNWGSIPGGNGGTLRVFEAQDTCALLTLSGTSASGTAEGRMSYWQNNDEVYPAGFGSGLDGTPVRHHKFPSIQFLNNSVWDSKYGVNALDVLGIKIINSAIDYNVVKGFRIGYAKRSLGDASVLGMGICMSAGTYEGQSPNILATCGGNWGIGSLNGSGDDIQFNGDFLRFNSFDLWQDRPSLLNAYVRNYIKLTANDIGGVPGSQTDYGNIAWGGFAPHTLYSKFSNFTKLSKITKTNLAATNILKKLDWVDYIPNNVRIDLNGYTIDNRGAEETVVGKYTVAPSSHISSGGTYLTSTGIQNSNIVEHTLLSALKVVKSNVFIDFANKTIIANPTIFRDQLSSHTLWDIGDCFIGMYSFAALAPINANAVLSTTEQMVNFKMHMQVGRHNVNNRYVTPGDYSTYFYPDAGVFNKGPATGPPPGIPQTNPAIEYWFWLNPKTARWNNFQYDKDFSATNDFNVVEVFTEDLLENLSDFAYRVIRSTKASRENALEDGWRSFKALDYFDTVRNKGLIKNLQAWGTDSLIIHHQHALFKTRDKAVLQTNIINVTLGSGDIFAIEPKEERSTHTGTGGTQHRYSCLLTPYGYFYTDAEVGRVYLYDGQDLKVVNAGFDTFFSEHLRRVVKDNPYNFDGLTMVYDQENERLILTQKENSYPATPQAEAIVGVPTGIINRHSFTISFDLDRQEWVSAHDYLPDFIFSTRINMYSFKGNNILKHNKIYDPLLADPENRGEFYEAAPPYVSKVYPFFVDFIINEGNREEKVLATINWLSKVINNTVPDTKGVYQRRTITHVTVWNDQHCTNRISIVTNETQSLFVDANAKIVDETWEFNDLFDNVIDPSLPFIDKQLNDYRPIVSNLAVPSWYDAEPLRGKYFIVRLEYDNFDGKEVHLRELIPTLRKSVS